jgi:hypothetical protein
MSLCTRPTCNICGSTIPFVFGDEESVMKELRKVFYDVLDISLDY